MNDSFQPKPEYGGFLPLELNNNDELFAKYMPNVIRFNSIKASIHHVFKETRIRTAYLPYYYCPSTIEAIRQMGIEINFYHIGSDLLPIEFVDRSDSAFLLVDYFGIRTKEVDAVSNRFQNAVVLIDRAHGFFGEPILRNRVYNIYSAKKFLGVPDGSYLVSKEIEQREQDYSNSNLYADYLILTYEEGTNRAYRQKKESDQIIADHYDYMSRLAYGLLCNVDYTYVRTSRITNFNVLNEKLGQINRLDLPDVCAAYHYPLLIHDNGQELKKRLVQERVYVPTLWNGNDLLQKGNAFELDIARNGIFLPMDQRYNPKDMEYIADRVLSEIRDR